MGYEPGKHTYLAAPFFVPAQRNLCNWFENVFNRFSLPLYSPRRDGFVLEPSATNEERDEIFRSNTVAIDTANWMLAIVDDFDPGVIWEMGYAFAKGVPTLCYTDVKDRGLNVMLAGSASLGFIDTRPRMRDLLSRMDSPGPANPFPMNTWRGRIQ